MDFDKVIYEAIHDRWEQAWRIGYSAYKDGLLRQCNLASEGFVTPGGHILKVYKSAWEQGWDSAFRNDCMITDQLQTKELRND